MKSSAEKPNNWKPRSNWTPQSRRLYPARHQPIYPNPEKATAVCREISGMPPLVFPGEVDSLRTQIAQAAAGDRFILHGGECVERFVDCEPKTIADRIRVLLQMSIILTYAARKPVTRIGRMAGQFFKPRSRDSESIDGTTVQTYRGDTVNGFEATAEQRTPNPDRLRTGYFHAAATLNYIRAMIAGGFADLHHPDAWNLEGMESAPRYAEYKRVLDTVLNAIRFMESFGGVNRQTLGDVEFFTSHEALHLDFEDAMTRFDHERWFNLGAHLVWVGERTRAVGEAHLEYVRGLANPIAVKLGPSTTEREVIDLCGILNPDNEAGRLMFITRFGHELIAERLPPILTAVKRAGTPVAWCVDPMHGNTVTTSGGRKTRIFDNVLSELLGAFRAHRESGTVLAGVHFEMTAEPVTECLGGAIGLMEDDLTRNYQTYCDPRLNYAQSIEMAFLIAEQLNEGHHQ